jgi:hypothetical protein
VLLNLLLNDTLVRQHAGLTRGDASACEHSPYSDSLSHASANLYLLPHVQSYSVAGTMWSLLLLACLMVSVRQAHSADTVYCEMRAHWQNTPLVLEARSASLLLLLTSFDLARFSSLYSSLMRCHVLLRTVNTSHKREIICSGILSIAFLLLTPGLLRVVYLFSPTNACKSFEKYPSHQRCPIHGSGV